MRDSLQIIDDEVVRLAELFVIARTDESLNDRLGISYNTWRKLKAGLPVRKSVAKRLTERLLHLQNEL